MTNNLRAYLALKEQEKNLRDQIHRAYSHIAKLKALHEKEIKKLETDAEVLEMNLEEYQEQIRKLEEEAHE